MPDDFTDENVETLERLAKAYYGRPGREIEWAVVDKIRNRGDLGLRKYGVTLDRDDLDDLAWLEHAQQEALDLAQYLEVLIQRAKRKKTTPQSNTNPP